MQTKQALKVLGTLLFLYGVFGYIYPDWGAVQFTNNENLFHVVTGLIAILAAHLAPRFRVFGLIAFTILFLALGIWGFSRPQATDTRLVFRRTTVTTHTQLDPIDNALHVAFGLAFAWFALKARA